MAEKKAVGLNPNTYIALTDHLAPLCVLLDIPLLLTDEKHCSVVQQLYPGIKTLLIEWGDFTPDYLINNFDVLLQSEQWPRDRFYAGFAQLEQHYGKTMRNVHCPHGFSDKIFWLEQCVFEDITLVYGNNMLDMFKERGLLSHLNAYVPCGNYRYSYYLQHQAFFDRLMDQKIGQFFSEKKTTILYAPTRNDIEENSSFFDSDCIYNDLPDEYNLIVKLHPSLEELDAPEIYKLLGRHSNKKNILFITDMPLVYPLLAKSDIYIGDSSSVGYDFLKFNRPMFFLNQRKRDTQMDRNAFLTRCGVEIKPEEYRNLYSIIASSLPYDRERFFETRQTVYRYTFGDPLSDEELRTSIIKSYDSNKKLEL